MRKPGCTSYKLISQLSFSFFVLISCGPSSKQDPVLVNPLNHGEKIGDFFSTFYWVVNEIHYPKGQSVSIRTLKGDVIAKVHPKFKKDVDMEGTGILRDGRTINYAGRLGKEIRYRVTSSKWGLGVGTCKLNPYRTIAVDPGIIPLGSVVYIPKAEHMLLPDGSIHDGLFRAEDVGGAINDWHVDFFTQEGAAASKPFEAVGIISSGSVEVFKFAEPVVGGCHELHVDSDVRSLQFFGRL